MTLGLCENQNYREKIVNNGFKQLQTYPSIQDKTKQEWNFINRIYENV